MHRQGHRAGDEGNDHADRVRTGPLRNTGWPEVPPPGQNEAEWEDKLVELFARLVADRVLDELKEEDSS